MNPTRPADTVATAMEPWRRQCADASRRLHLIDIENLVGMNPADADEDVIRGVLQTYIRLVRFGAGEHAVAAYNRSPRWAFAVHDVLPGINVHAQGGKHGAELAILSQVRPRLVADRYGAVWIGSGDAAFTDFAVECRRLGVTVVVVALRRAIARTLAAVASRVVPFPATTQRFDSVA